MAKKRTYDTNKSPRLKKKNTKKSQKMIIFPFCSYSRNLYQEKNNQKEEEGRDKTDKMTCK